MKIKFYIINLRNKNTPKWLIKWMRSWSACSMNSIFTKTKSCSVAKRSETSSTRGVSRNTLCKEKTRQCHIFLRLSSMRMNSGRRKRSENKNIRARNSTFRIRLSRDESFTSMTELVESSSKTYHFGRSTSNFFAIRDRPKS